MCGNCWEKIETYRVQWGFLSQLVTLKWLVVYRTVYILSEEENLLQPVTTINVKRTPLSQSGNNSFPCTIPWHGLNGHRGHHTFLGNCAPTPPLSQHFALIEK